MNTKTTKVIEALWETFHYCEFCQNPNQSKTYLPLSKETLNPMHICEDCVNQTVYGEKFKIIKKMSSKKEYYQELMELKDQ